MPAKKFNPRSLFLPKYPELEEQCPSCPFRDGNYDEFGAIVKKLQEVHPDHGVPSHVPLIVVSDMARLRIRDGAQTFGDFSCHHTVYNEDMSTKPQTEWRQCPGATEFFKDAGKEISV